jgi:hypothetical protein
VLVEESEQEQTRGPFQKPDQQGDGGEDTEEEDEDGEQQELPLPLFRK